LLVGRSQPVRAHARKANTVRLIGHRYRYQRTLAHPITVAGVGFITGSRVSARFRPAPPDSGIVFSRTDCPGSPLVPAHADCVTSTQRRTTLGPPETGVTLAEHVLASLAGLHIDNCLVELDGPEPPGLDGSSRGFVDALVSAGAVLQSARRPIYTVTEPVLVCAPGATLALHPVAHPADTELRISYRLDYGPHAPIPPQLYTVPVAPGTFLHEIAPCRTFLTEREAVALRAQGIGRHLRATDLVVFGARGPIENRTRFADEPARHKVLDLIGDLALCGFDLAGHVVAYRSGHTLNVELARTLSAGIQSASQSESQSESQKSTSRKVVKSALRAA
jgi:UDP-3-O-acyl N-acetylglucosamine deacetylase